MEKDGGNLALITIFFIYFLPALIAYRRRHRQFVPLTLLNLLFGWTGLGWVIVFMWSWSPDVKLV
jgi:hypothetical protein